MALQDVVQNPLPLTASCKVPQAISREAEGKG